MTQLHTQENLRSEVLGERLDHPWWSELGDFVECRYERQNFRDEDFEQTEFGFVHRGRLPLHLSNGEIVRDIPLESPVRAKFVSLIQEAQAKKES